MNIEFDTLTATALASEFADPEGFVLHLANRRIEGAIAKLKALPDWTEAATAHAATLAEGETQTDMQIVDHGLSLGLFVSAVGRARAEAEAAKPTLPELRAATHLARFDFCAALKAAGVLSDAEAIAGTKGDWPDSFTPFLSGMTDDESTLVQMQWADASEISRVHPMIGPLAALAEISEPQLDAMFGITPEMYRADA